MTELTLKEWRANTETGKAAIAGAYFTAILSKDDFICFIDSFTGKYYKDVKGELMELYNSLEKLPNLFISKGFTDKSLNTDEMLSIQNNHWQMQYKNFNFTYEELKRVVQM